MGPALGRLGLIWNRASQGLLSKNERGKGLLKGLYLFVLPSNALLLKNWDRSNIKQQGDAVCWHTVRAFSQKCLEALSLLLPLLHFHCTGTHCTATFWSMTGRTDEGGPVRLPRSGTFPSPSESILVPQCAAHVLTVKPV